LQQRVDVLLLLIDLSLHFFQLLLRLQLFVLQLLLVRLTKVDVEKIVLLNLVEVVDKLFLCKVIV